MLEGRVMQRGDSLAISTELVDARDNSHIWGQQYTRNAADVFAVQEEIAKEMTAALRMRLSGEDEKRMTKSYTANPEAYQLYLQGRYWQNKRSLEGYHRSIEYFQQAIEKDPTYALAYSGLADAYSGLPGSGLAAPNETIPKAKEAARKALEMDDTLAEAHTSLAIIETQYDWDWGGGEKEFQRAMELNPNYAYAYQSYGLVLRETGRLEEALQKYKRALELDPLSVSVNRDLGYTFYDARQYDQAIEQERKTLELDPNYAQAHSVLGRAYLQKAMFGEGIAEFEKELLTSPGGTTGLPDLGRAYALAGRKAEAQKVLDRIFTLSKQEYLLPKNVAAFYAALGEKDKAFEWLEKAYQERSLGFGLSMKSSPVYDPLRSDPRFADLLRRMNLQP